jgi:anti-sigma B factor antagonist
MAPVLESATIASDGHAVVTVRGDIAADTAIELWQHLSYLVGQGHQHLVLDLGGMVLIDSAGVEVLARVAEWTRHNGGALVLRSASLALVEQLKLARRAEAHRHHPSQGRRYPAAGRRPTGSDVPYAASGRASVRAAANASVMIW